MVPDYQALMLPILRVMEDGAERDSAWLRNAVATRLQLTAEDRAEMLPSGTQRRFDNRVAWARFYLERAGALRRIRRGTYAITDRGRQLLHDHPTEVNANTLTQFPEFNEFRARSGRRADAGDAPGESLAVDDAQSPTEQMASAFRQHTSALESDLLERIRQCDPDFFERLVLQVLVKMGYGGSVEEAGQHLGGSGDGGVDGVINEDQLGLDQIYVQAKRRTESTVGRPEVQAFVGALEGKGATKGVFITSSRFTDDAHEYANRVNRRVSLIDGERLARLMVRHGIGVTVGQSYLLQVIDEDFFLDE